MIEKFIRLDGQPIDVEVSGTYSTHDGKPAVLTVFLDISERETRSRLYTQRLQILREIYRAILAAESPEAIAQAVLGRVRQLVNYEWSSLTLFDFQAGMTIRRIAVVTDTSRLRSRKEKQIPLEHFRGLDTLQSGRSFSVDDVTTVDEPSPGELRMIERGIRSYANIPLLVGGELIGSLNVESTRPGDFPASKIEILREVAGPLAIAIQQANLLEQIRSHADEMEQRVIDRTRELSVLYRVSAIAIESLDIHHTLEASLEAVLDNINAPSGAIQTLDSSGSELKLIAQHGLTKELISEMDQVASDHGLAGITIQAGETVVLPDIGLAKPSHSSFTAAGFRSYIGVPVRAAGIIAAVLSVFGKDALRFTTEEIALLGVVADQIGIVIENARLRDSAERAAALEERERLAQDLHDSVTQSLYSLTLFARAAQEHANHQRWEHLGDRLADITESSVQALKEMRLLVHQLQPSALQQEGLLQALQKRLDAVEKRSGLDATIAAEGNVDLAESIEMNLYLLALEALNNALKHSGASKVAVSLKMTPKLVEMSIEDNGSGFDLVAVERKGGMGLANMQARVARMGGTISILPASETGTRVTIKVDPTMVGEFDSSQEAL
jgi:signal transduction histidine kinase